jgi:(2R)-3-sulfolactate dehydrogenase (NADP+)
VAFRGVGVAEPVAACVAQSAGGGGGGGQVGHGFSRLADYAGQVRTGKIRAGAEVTVSRRGRPRSMSTRGCGFAYPALDAAYEAGVPLAREMGIAVMAIGNSHHCGALSVQVERYAEAG